MEFKVTSFLSSREFYGMVDVLNEILVPDEAMILDMTEVARIDSPVIPNLLLLGQFIERKTKNIPRIRLGDDLRAGYLKNYLNGIGFYRLCDSYYMFEHPDSKYGGLIGKAMDARNTTERFFFDEDPALVQRRLQYNVYPFLRKYMDYFSPYRNDLELNENTIARFLCEMISNSFKYGRSDVIVTVQANYHKNRIYLSVSDSGTGFLEPMLKCMDLDGQFYKTDAECAGLVTEDADTESYNVFGRKPGDEKEAVIMGLYKRKNSKTHGLYHLVDKALHLGGTVRIHSNTVQLILTGRLHKAFREEQIVSNDQLLKKFNIVKTSLFPGSHIEMELPLGLE